MKLRLKLFLILLSTGRMASAQPPGALVENVADQWLNLHNNFQQPADVWGNYTLDLTLEALLYYDYWTKSKRYKSLVLDVFDKRETRSSDTISYKTQPFCSINYTLGKITGNSEWYTGFIYESYRMYENAVKSKECGILIKHQGNHYLLIDYLQEYASRLAKTGYLTKDSLLFRECVNQFLIYEKIVKDESTGLWKQGRGWCEDPSQLSQGAWSRGHGWLLRGIVSSMLHLPYSYQTALQPVLERISHALLNARSKSGMYHILLSLPENQSVPDVSGTGMIAWYLAIAIQNGWLNEQEFKPAILASTKAMREDVAAHGEIVILSKGPGPLCTQEEYIDYQPEINEKHGFQGVIYGMLAEIVLKK